MHKMLHPKADVERLYISGKDGGRGLIDVEAAFKSVTIGLNHYLRHKEGQYPKQVLGHERYKAKNSIARNATNFKREITARYPRILEKPQADTVTTNKWLSSNLKGKTEGLLFAAQDRAVNARNYQKQEDGKCIMCSQYEETAEPYSIRM
ncbi:unnamed protein product [Pocillopora meandrina]|uniref:Uncharacterized protein n=1 Tax=Pocillopora meandrina TaxID=46732 RepID=A0AAU9XL67_9CNID|nr:unnamed protein product [Pocillopora meandrina]